MLLWTWVQTSTAGINILFCNHRSSRASLCRWGQKSAGSQSKCAVVCSVDWSPAAPRFFLGDCHFQRQELMLNIPLSGWRAHLCLNHYIKAFRYPEWHIPKHSIKTGIGRKGWEVCREIRACRPKPFPAHPQHFPHKTSINLGQTNPSIILISSMILSKIKYEIHTIYPCVIEYSSSAPDL